MPQNFSLFFLIVNSNSLKGTLISDGSNLNNYNDTGSYYTGSTASTGTITNKPSALTSAFNMLVLNKGGNNVQVIFDYGGKIYIRGKISSGWTNWYVFTGTAGN